MAHKKFIKKLRETGTQLSNFIESNILKRTRLQNHDFDISFRP